ncbi:MAG: hypothetical protein ACTSP4_06980 [Candidatus Hodarchaeales archaeon]
MGFTREADRDRLNRIIFETSSMPFGINAYNPNEPVTDFVGRRDELFFLKEKIQLVWKHKISLAVRLEGPAGVGKSTLFNFLKESIEQERSNSQSTTTYLSKNTDIISTYLQAPDRVTDFRDLWKPMLEGLLPGFELETKCDIGLPEYVALRLIYRMFKNDPETLSRIIWPDSNLDTPLKYVEFVDIISPILSGKKDTIERLQSYYKENKRSLRKLFKSKINGVSYEIKRADNKLIHNLLRTLDEDDPEEYLEKINNADPELFPNTDELIKFFNSLMRLYACGTGKQPLLLFGIDEIAKTEDEIGEEYYRMLGTLFVRLRNSLNSILFIFVSTTEDWAKYDSVITKQSDLYNQISVFLNRLPLNQLSVDEMINVFKNRMNRFWGNYPSEKPVKNPYYPFSSEIFDYVYRYEKRNLRKSIQFLHKLWSNYRLTAKIPVMETSFDCMRILRSFIGKELVPYDINKFEWDIIINSFNDSNRYKTSAARSSAVEKGLEYAWKCMQFEKGTMITRVENNPRMKTSSGTRRPDVIVEIHGNLGAQYRRVVEFQVKIYRDNHFVRFDHIESSLELFNEQYTDMIYFIITGGGLDSEAEYKVKELESKYQARIRRPKLTVNQERYLYYLALYEEITGHKLGSRGEKDVDIAKYLLANILMQPVDNFLAGLKSLTFRKPVITVEEIESVEETVIESKKEISPFISVKSLPVEVNNVSGNTPVEDRSVVTAGAGTHKTKDNNEVKEIKWLEMYPEIEIYKYEACGLCSYLRTREGGRYKNKFTVNTVLKNVIRKDMIYSPQKFKELVKFLESKNYIEKVKSSYILTNEGENFYQAVKKGNFNC